MCMFQLYKVKNVLHSALMLAGQVLSSQNPHR